MTSPDHQPHYPASESLELLTLFEKSVRSGNSELAADSKQLIVGSQELFLPAVPKILSWVAHGDPAILSQAADLLLQRAHWIEQGILDGLVIPCIEFNAPLQNDLDLGDALVKGAIVNGPRLNKFSAQRVGDMAVRQFRNEDGVSLSSNATLALLGESLPVRFKPLALASVRSVIHDYHSLLGGKIEDPALLLEQRGWLFRAAITGIFALRSLFSDPEVRASSELGSAGDVLDEARSFVQTMAEQISGEQIPESSAFYQLLLTTQLIDPANHLPSRAAIDDIVSCLTEPLPFLANLIARLSSRENFLEELPAAIESFNAEESEQTLYFLVCLLDATLRLEEKPDQLSTSERGSLDSQLEAVQAKIVDPLIAYYAAELSRVIRSTNY